ncbi:MAG: glycosyltransferase family 4 protein [Nitrospira sp.]|nr:glycosyltransferase family 4 protein [Nitrospira sp.]
MKIVHVNDVIYGYATGDALARGGAERYGWYLMRALASAGWSVTVGVRSALAAGDERAVDGVRFLGIGNRTFLSDWYRFLHSEKPDWCFWQCADHLWGPASEIARWFGVRTAFSMMHDNHVQLRKALSRRGNWWPLYAWGLQRSDVIFVQHEGQRVQLPLRWQRRAYPLPGIVSLTGTVVSHSERNNAVVWVAVIRPAKRPDLLIEIARRLPTVRFVVCGAPSLSHWEAGTIERIMKRLRSLPNVDYQGHVAPEQTLKIIGEAGLLLSTSDGEGFPSVFLEAWAAGTPVVSLQIDPDHKIRNGDLGKVTDTVDGAVDTVRSFMTSPERLREMGMKARRHVEELHSPMAAVRAFETAVARSSDSMPAGLVRQETR